MIRYELRCDAGDVFEAWFRNSADYDAQAERGLLECPHCGSGAVQKAIMAPAVKRSRSVEADPAAVLKALAAKARAHINETYEYVGDCFVEEVRKINDGDAEHRPIWGEATVAEARALIEEGAPVAPLPPEFAPSPPRKVN